MTVTPDELTRVILEIRNDLVSSGAFASFEEINSGACTDFVHHVYDRIGREAARGSIGIYGIDNFMQSDEDHDFNEGFPMDRELLEEHWPAVVPTQNMTWDDLDKLSEAAGFNSGTHVFMEMNERFYDAEAPEGVDNFLDLPFFQRVIASWIEEEAPHIKQRGAQVSL